MFDETLEKKDLFLLASRLKEKVNDPRNAKEHHESFLRKKNKKSVKQSQIITCWYKMSYCRTSKNFTEIIQDYNKGKKVGSSNFLYNDTKKTKNFLNEKNVKITKREHVLKAMQVLIC